MPKFRDRQSNVEADDTQVPELATFRDTFTLLQNYRTPMLLALAIGLAGAAVSAIQPLIVADIVDAFGGDIPASRLLLVVVLLLMGAVLTGLKELIIERTGERFAFDTRERIVRRIYALPMARLSGRERGDLVSRVTTDVAETRSILTSGLVDVGVSAATVMISVVMMALLDPWLLVLAVIAVVIVMAVAVVLGIRMRPVGYRMQSALGKLAEAVSRALGGIRTIKAARAVDQEAQLAISRAGEVLQAGRAVATLRAIVQTATGVAIQVLLIVIVGVGALRVASGALSIGQLSAFVMYLMLMITPVGVVANVVSLMSEALGSLSRIKEIESWQIERDIEAAVAQATTSADDGPVFSFENVGFTYPDVGNQEQDGEQAAALQGISFSIEQGTTTAFVGLSGSGKSTIFALMERFYEPTYGRISFNGQDVNRISRDHLRSQISYVDQDAVVLSGTVRDNLHLAAPSAPDSDCIDTLLQVGLVASTEEGASFLDRSVGELGSRLSGGERQRLAIARAVLTEAPILLLDEITSNLDSYNEHLASIALQASAGTRTTMVIAHRISTVVAADQIIVLEQGQIVARGTHNELMTLSSIYRDLAKRQLIGSNSDTEDPAAQGVDESRELDVAVPGNEDAR